MTYLPKDAAQGDVVRAVFAHELTHRAEESKFYREMADALLKWKYGDNVKQREADRKARYDLYKPQYQNTAERAAEFEQNGDAIAEANRLHALRRNCLRRTKRRLTGSLKASRALCAGLRTRSRKSSTSSAA